MALYIFSLKSGHKNHNLQLSALAYPQEIVKINIFHYFSVTFNSGKEQREREKNHKIVIWMEILRPEELVFRISEKNFHWGASEKGYKTFYRCSK